MFQNVKSRQPIELVGRPECGQIGSRQAYMQSRCSYIDRPIMQQPVFAFLRHVFADPDTGLGGISANRWHREHCQRWEHWLKRACMKRHEPPSDRVDFDLGQATRLWDAC